MPLRDLLLSAVITVLLPVCFARPWVGILVWTWIGMMSPQWLTSGFALEIPWALLVGVTTIAGVVCTRDRKPIPWNGQLLLMVLLLACFSLTTVFAWVPDVALAKLKLSIKVALMAIVATKVIYGRDRIRWLLIVIVASVGFYGVKGGIWAIATGGNQMVYGPDGGFMEGNNAIGLALLMIVPVMFALAREERRKWVSNAYICAALLSCVSVVFTYSRGAMVGLAACGTFLLMGSRKKFLAVLLIVPLLAAGISLAPDKVFRRAETITTYEEDGSAMQRLAAWSVNWNVAIDHPLTGAGFDFFYTPDQVLWLSYMNPDYRQYLGNSCAAHSIYFQILGEHGFVTFGLFLTLLFSTLRRCAKLTKATRGDPDVEWIGNYAYAIRVGLIGYMVSGAFLSFANFDLAWIYYTFTAILGRELAANIAHNPSEEKKQAASTVLDMRPKVIRGLPAGATGRR